MMNSNKILVTSCYDSVFFEVDAVHIDINATDTILEQFNSVINDPNYQDHLVLVFDNYIDARNCAEQIVQYDSKYNYAVVTLEKYSKDETTLENVCDISEGVAEFGSATPEQINQYHTQQDIDNGKFKLASSDLTYFWCDHGNARNTDLATKIEEALTSHDYDSFIKLWYTYKDGSYIYLPYVAVDTKTNEDYNITIKDNFMHIAEHEYEWG